MRMHDLDDLVGQKEIADLFGLSRSSAVNNWADRYDDFPKPLLQIGNTPIYSWVMIRLWHLKKWPNSAYKAGYPDEYPKEEPPVVDAEIQYDPDAIKVGYNIRIILEPDKWLPPGDYTVRRINE